MFKLVRSVANNINERRYIKEAGNLVVKKSTTTGDSINPPKAINEERVLRELQDLEVDMRYNNLRIFMRNIIPCRLKQFFLYTVPALIVAGGITLFVLPSTYTTTDNLEAFKKEEIVFLNGKQMEIENDDTYYGVYIPRTYVDENNKNTDPFEVTKLDFYVTENLEGFRLKARVDSNGELSIDNAEKGEYFDIHEYDESSFTEIEPKYVELFDKVVDLVTKSTYFGGKDDDRLIAMSDSEKSYIVGSLVTYYSTGFEDVEVVKSNWWLRIATLVVLGLYDWLIIYLKREQYVFESRKLNDRNGSLEDSGSTYDMSLFNLALKYKEAFMDAEEHRIKRIKDLLEAYFEEGTVDKVLTGYEKKLVLK